MNKRSCHEAEGDTLLLAVILKTIPCLQNDLVSIVMSYQRENKFLRFIHQNQQLPMFLIQDHNGHVKLIQRVSFNRKVFEVAKVFYDQRHQYDSDQQDLQTAVIKNRITNDDDRRFWLVRNFTAISFSKLSSLIRFRSILAQLTEPVLVRHDDLQNRHLFLHETRACVAFTQQLEQSDSIGDLVVRW